MLLMQIKTKHMKKMEKMKKQAGLHATWINSFMGEYGDKKILKELHRNVPGQPMLTMSFALIGGSFRHQMVRAQHKMQIDAV